MAKLYFYYATMNAGKSTALLQSAYNYKERGMTPLLLKPAVDTRDKEGSISSRIGLSADATVFEKDANLFEVVQTKAPDCALLDEAQFLTKQQVKELARVVDELSIPVLAYGLRTDFQGELFEGSHYLLAWADELVERKAVCHCGKKTTMNIRVDDAGNKLEEGDQVEIGGNETYVAVCRYHYHHFE